MHVKAQPRHRDQANGQALCSERLFDWRDRFKGLNLTCSYPEEAPLTTKASRSPVTPRSTTSRSSQRMPT
jgi:hypothetical protein